MAPAVLPRPWCKGDSRRTAFDPSLTPRSRRGAMKQAMQFRRTAPGYVSWRRWLRVGSSVTWRRERVRNEARSALGAGKAGRADHQERVVYQRGRLQASPAPTPRPPGAGDSRLLNLTSVLRCRRRPRTDALYNQTMAVTMGLERLLDSGRLDGRRVGIVCNPSSIDRHLRHAADRLAAHPKARLTAIFGPQHGFRSDVQENMIESGHAHDEVRGVPVY